MAKSLEQLVKERIRRLYAERKFRKTRVAERLNVVHSAISRYINGESPISLKVLEAIAELTGTGVAELVAPPDAILKQLNAEEARLLRHFREWPAATRHALIAFVGYFADEPAIDTQGRNLREIWRRASVRDRQLLYAVAVMQHEGMLPRDIAGELEHRLGVAQARAEKRRKSKQPTDDAPKP